MKNVEPGEAGRGEARATAPLLVATALGFARAFSVLSVIWEYPGIPRQLTDRILRPIAEGGLGQLRFHSTTVSRLLRAGTP